MRRFTNRARWSCRVAGKQCRFPESIAEARSIQSNVLARLGLRPGVDGPLVETADFGSNPGGLRMFAYVPQTMQQPRALVVVLHGCGQTASSYDHGAGWSTLAKHFGFALLMPEQRVSNSANGCFNWFNPED